MLVSHRYNFIYTKTGKTAGTSVESYFERYCMREGEWSFSHFRDEYESEAGIIGCRGFKRTANSKWWNHMPAALIREKIGEATWTNYFKFCVIRNPYDKVLSAFYYFKNPEMRSEHNRVAELGNLDEDIDAFENWLSTDGPPVDRDKYLIDGQFCLDQVIRYETLAADLEKICARLKIPWEPALLPTLKSGFRPREANSKSLYTKKSKEIVKEAYSYELEHFRYSFPDD
jgi:hypothetical protein